MVAVGTISTILGTSDRRYPSPADNTSDHGTLAWLAGGKGLVYLSAKSALIEII